MLKVFKKLKKILFGIKKKDIYPKEDGITFMHHQPLIFNIGDYLCSPRHYFKFTNPIEDLVIVGGGVFAGFAKKRLKKNDLKIHKSILWAIGESQKDEFDQQKKITNLPFLHWGLRDLDRVTDEHFLPCVSCLHPMLDIDISGSGTVLFLNADVDVTSNDNRKNYTALAEERGWNIVFNNCSEKEMEQILSGHKHIITNSYHGAYWGLLTGHNVTLFGYSSKFSSLLRGFGLNDTQLIRIERGSGKALLDAIKMVNDDSKSIKLNNHKKVLNDFRKKNIAFANDLVKKGIISGFTFKKKDMKIPS